MHENGEKFIVLQLLTRKCIPNNYRVGYLTVQQFKNLALQSRLQYIAHTMKRKRIRPYDESDEAKANKAE